MTSGEAGFSRASTRAAPRQELDLCEPGAEAASGRAISFHDLAELIGEPLGSEISIESLRSGPATHRHLDTTALARSFPLLRLNPLEDAIGQSIRGLQGSSGR